MPRHNGHSGHRKHAKKRKNRHKRNHKQVARRVMAREQEWRCHYCGGVMDKAPGSHDNPTGVTIDHVRPRCRGGDDSPENLVACCYRCNQDKGDQRWIA